MTIEIKEVINLDGLTHKIVFIYDDNGGCTQMQKSVYDEMIANQPTL